MQVFHTEWLVNFPLVDNDNDKFFVVMRSLSVTFKSKLLNMICVLFNMLYKVVLVVIFVLACGDVFLLWHLFCSLCPAY